MSAYFWIPKPDFRPVKTSVLEKWYGRNQVEQISQNMLKWYGPPIPLTHMPGNVVAVKGGDFAGQMFGNRFTDPFYRVMSNGFYKAGLALSGKFHKATFGAGFTSLSDLISEATVGGKRVTFIFRKAGSTGVSGVSNSLLQLGSQPVAAANASAAPGGDIPVDSTTGFPLFTNPTGGDTLHVTNAWGTANVAGMSALLYDCLFRVNKTMNSTGTEAVTGVPTRYQNTTGGAVDSAEGNFLFIQVGLTALAATAHNWTVCQYTDQSGNTGVTLPTVTGNASAIVHRLDHPAADWFAPLASGDTGIAALTQMQCSAAVATGVINFVIGHPIAWMMFPAANIMIPFDYINTAFNLARIFDDAALSLLEVCKSATTATTYNVYVNAVHG